MVTHKENENIRTYNHPIADQHIDASPQDGVTVEDVHAFLEEVAEVISEEYIRDTAGAMPYEALAENEDCVGTYNATWEVIFEEIGLTLDSAEYDEPFVDYAQYAVTTSHQRHAVAELGMDHNQPTYMLVASKDE